ncbi:hypothetical protein NMG29_31270 [Streptomyces cocklensis]|jgi:hypothetical protein|uniref:Uncharacterized protein n=1 Tax=Actinacidiphila cocklensis TaxID=887465 RepID=A0A9W4DQH4_9ACTN|nr:hypothetical protein [Actinacidiphila cocklensis]MDD1062630.1 hypothetical protein [Actinacidiphila cocklensis]WSX75486.1 hypothetical protein OH826_17245 [Streptomyces sp. NBC_00899]CAG6392168.1 conserved exported hypothetical protein [Actinacidiphila cocklensis]
MTPAAQRSSRQATKRATKKTAAAPKSGAGRSRASGTTATRTTKTRSKASSAGQHQHDVTITIPVDSAASAVGKVVTLPVTAAQRILPSAGGLPLYVGLGALGIAGILEWPVAAGIGVGYAVLRQGGPLNPHPEENPAK